MKLDSLRLETEALLRCRFKTKFDLTSGPDHPLPRKRTVRSSSKKPRHGAMIQRVSGGSGHLAVCGDFAAVFNGGCREASLLP